MPISRVLHSAGNRRDLHPLARHPAVDAIEADMWVRGGRLVAHHERPLGAIPLLLHRRGLSRAPRDPIRLDELLDAVRGHSALVLDLRSWFGDPAPDAARELLALSDRSHLSVSCEAWTVAARLRAWLPDLTVVYSLRSELQLRRYIAGRIDGSIERTAVAVRHTLLHSADEVGALRHHAGRVAAWTVGDAERAIELVGWGVDEIVSGDLQVLNSV